MHENRTMPPGMMPVTGWRGTVMRGFVAVLLVAMALPATAQTVQKCVDAKGHVTFTSGGCAAGQAHAASYAAEPERYDPAAARRVAEFERWQRGENARQAASRNSVSWNPPRPAASPSRHSRCEAAKRHRDAQVERLGLSRTHADLRRLDAPVYEACK